MVQRPRVVITGLGAVAPNGIGKEAFWDALIHGRSGIDRITRFDASQFPCQIAGEVRDFQPTAYLNPQEAKRIPLVSQFAIAAAKMAFDDSSIRVTPEKAGSIGVCFGTCIGMIEAFETEHIPFLNRGVRAVHPLSHLEITPHAVSSHVAITLGLRGVCGTVSTGCTTGLDVIQWGYQQICLGRATMMVVGGAEALLAPFGFGTICAAGVLAQGNGTAQKASRPFERDRNGLVLGEGAGAVMLEELTHAQERHATLYAEILGYASKRDGQDLIRCDLSGANMLHVMEMALYQSGLPKTRLDYVNAHGVGLRDYDTAETNAIKGLFGLHAYNIPVSSIKSMIGHAPAAAGALQVVTSCLTLEHGIIPPTINYDAPDPCCDLDYVPNRARRARVRTVLVHAHGMGGGDSALVLGRVGS